MNGAQQFPGWGRAEVSEFGRPTSECEFLSDFFCNAPPQMFPPATVAGTMAPTAAVRANDEEVESASHREGKQARTSTSRSSSRGKEDAGGSNDFQEKRKRNRTTEMHNMTERRRRDKIKGKLKALQEIIPNAQKLDRATLLDETIEYVKNLQMQVQALMMPSAAYCHSPCMSPSPSPCIHMPHFSPFSRSCMGYGMRMSSMGCPVQPPMISIPSPHQATSFVPMAGFNTVPAFCPLSQPMPFGPMPEYTAAMSVSVPSPPVLQSGPFRSCAEEPASLETEAAAATQKPCASVPISTTS